MRILRLVVDVPGLRSHPITLVTTLLDPKLFPAHELAKAYARRWRLEMCRRDLKTTLGMESLRGQSPAMARQEMFAFFIAHNLTRWVMAEAANLYDADLERMSFKGTLDALRQYSAAISAARNQKMRQQLWQDLLLNRVRDQVPFRPHRTRYWKGNPRKS